MVTYYELGTKRQLNEVVFAGTHDAGITGGGSGVQTQSLNILQQAIGGVRFCDVRVAAAVTSQTHSSGRPVAELRAFHADDKVVMKLDRNVVLKGKDDPSRVTQSKLAGGAFGLALSRMLEQAKDFVESQIGRNEFLILKLDKCTNWIQIASACWDALGKTRYTGGGNLNTKTLGELRGQVIVLFSAEGLSELPAQKGGILGFKDLSSDGAACDPMWDAPNISKMKALWSQGLSDFVSARVSLPSTNPFPNIVMTDFADHTRCKQFRDLNDPTAEHLSALS